MIAMIGTSDRLCWLAETCKILLLLLVQQGELHSQRSARKERLKTKLRTQPGRLACQQVDFDQSSGSSGC